MDVVNNKSKMVKFNLKQYADWIHIVQLLSLVVFGLAIFSQQTLTNIGIDHMLGMRLAFFGLIISLGYEHFLNK